METTAFVRMRNAFEAFADSYEQLTIAIRQAWEAERKHGAEHWQRICNEEIGDLRGRVPKDIRKAIVKELAKDGLSNRDLAAAFGVSREQARKDARGDNKVVTNSAPEEPTEVNAELDGIAKATHAAELESVRAELTEARAEVAKLKRLSALEGELNELRVSLAVIRSQARKKVGEGDMLFKLIENAMKRIISIEEKGENN